MADSNLAAAIAPDVSGPPPSVSDTAPSLGATPQPTPPTPIPPEISGAKPSAPESPVSDPLSLSMQPAQPKQPDLPRFQRTFKNTLQGMLLGLAEGNVLGMVQGAIDPQAPIKYMQQQRETAQANATFASARAGHELAQITSLEQQLNAFCPALCALY